MSRSLNLSFFPEISDLAPEPKPVCDNTVLHRGQHQGHRTANLPTQVTGSSPMLWDFGWAFGAPAWDGFLWDDAVVALKSMPIFCRRAVLSQGDRSCWLTRRA